MITSIQVEVSIASIMQIIEKINESSTQIANDENFYLKFSVPSYALLNAIKQRKDLHCKKEAQTKLIVNDSNESLFEYYRR